MDWWRNEELYYLLVEVSLDLIFCKTRCRAKWSTSIYAFVLLPYSTNADFPLVDGVCLYIDRSLHWSVGSFHASKNNCLYPRIDPCWWIDARCSRRITQQCTNQNDESPSGSFLRLLLLFSHLANIEINFSICSKLSWRSPAFSQLLVEVLLRHVNIEMSFFISPDGCTWIIFEDRSSVCSIPVVANRFTWSYSLSFPMINLRLSFERSNS